LTLTLKVLKQVFDELPGSLEVLAPVVRHRPGELALPHLLRSKKRFEGEVSPAFGDVDRSTQQQTVDRSCKVSHG
jgi:hypothetical protein